MAWEYMHFKNVTEARMKEEAHPTPAQTPLEAFLNMYGNSNWELIYVARSGSSYELIFKSKK